ncbi:MAG: 50S ribosomal protein L11 methyltransferase [Sphingobacterium sp.]
MKYTAVSFRSDNIQDWQKDLLIAELGHLGFDSFEDQEQGFVAYIPDANLDLQALETLLVVESVGYAIDFEVQEIEHQNWNEIWESNFQPITIGQDCYVRATFHESRPDFLYQIIVDPKMAFGTGHHQTTSMMLAYILENDFQDKKILDMGCGTGILAILAKKRGADSVLAIDFDQTCIDSVEENKKRNDAEDIETKLGSKEVIQGRHFDIILANINRNILLDQLPAYVESLNPDGELYLSGFYDNGEDLELLQQDAARHGMRFIEKKVLDTWCAVKFKKGN